MSRARILADYVSSGDELADKLNTTTAASTYAPKASPTFTGTVAIPNVANLETAVVANTAKVTNATHTGDVTGGTGLTIADNAVTLAKMAGLARGKLIVGDSSGNPSALAVGSVDEVLTHDGTDFDWAAAAGGGFSSNVSFMAYSTGSSWVTPSNNSELVFAQERHDVGSNYSTSTYRFTAPATGLYYFGYSIYAADNDDSNSFGFLKDGAENTSITGSDGQHWGSSYVGSTTGDHLQNYFGIYYLSSGDEISVASFDSSDFYPGHSFWFGGRIW